MSVQPPQRLDNDHSKCCRYLRCAHPMCCGYSGEPEAALAHHLQTTDAWLPPRPVPFTPPKAVLPPSCSHCGGIGHTMSAHF